MYWPILFMWLRTVLALLSTQRCLVTLPTWLTHSSIFFVFPFLPQVFNFPLLFSFFLALNMPFPDKKVSDLTYCITVRVHGSLTIGVCFLVHYYVCKCVSYNCFHPTINSNAQMDDDWFVKFSLQFLKGTIWLGTFILNRFTGTSCITRSIMIQTASMTQSSSAMAQESLTNSSPTHAS